jgi:putative FmdB family regulatory protein
MPTYEYQCQACTHKFEIVQRMTEDSLKTCPECNQDQLQKLISAVGFQLKGTGWYETDFKNSGKPPAAKSDSEGSSTTKSADTGSSKGTGETTSGDSSATKTGDSSTTKTKSSSDAE